jgi:hypothetical protein
MADISQIPQLSGECGPKNGSSFVKVSISNGFKCGGSGHLVADDGAYNPDSAANHCTQKDGFDFSHILFLVF